MNVSRRVTSTVAKSVAGRVTVVGNEVGPISSFSVATLNPLQWTHDASTPYYDANSPLDGIAVLNSRESYGDYRAPMPPYCAAFDGSNDILSGAITPTSMTTLCMFFRMKKPNVAQYSSLASGASSFGTHYWFYTNVSSQKLAFRDGATVAPLSTLQALNDNVWHDVGFIFNAGTLTYLVDGTSETVSVGGDGVLTSSGTDWIGMSSYQFAGRLSRLAVYTDLKTVSDFADWRDGSDLANAIALYDFNERSGATHYDRTGNSKHLTIANAVTTYGGGYHVTDADLPGNISNSLGYSLSGTVVIPRDESDTANDVLGNPLDYAGQCPYPVNPLVPCVSNNGAGTVYISAPHLTGSETVSSYSGSTATPTISSGRIDWDASTTLGDITLSDGTRYTCQEGIGSGSNRTLYDVSGSANDATLVNGVAADIWAATLNDVEDWSIKYGGGTGAGGEFIPGNTSGSLCVDGSSKTIPAGTPNAATILDLNPFGAGELTSRSVPTDFADGDDLNATVTPTDSAFASTDRIKIVVLPEAATGDDLTGMEDYVS